MASHVWDSVTDFEYCNLTNCELWADHTITLDGEHLTGTITSDIRDSTHRLFRYDEVIPSITVPTGTKATFYVRSGFYKNYTPDTWSDWVCIEEGVKMFEYTLSLTNAKIIADYDIKEISNIYYNTSEKFRRLAANMTTAFINSISEDDIELVNQFESLWSALVNVAMAGFARTDYDPTLASIYAQDATFANNTIRLKNTLPQHNVPLVIEYFPRNFVYVAGSGRYFQWKCELETYQANVTPCLKNMVTNYTLDFQDQIENEFPNFIRRL